MDKIEQLIRMMEEPNRYSQKEWENVLADKDCREYYRLMCDTATVLKDQKVDKQHNGSHRPDQAETEDALLRFQQRYMPGSRHTTLWRQVAAVFAGLVLMSGLAFATVALVNRHSTATRKEVAMKPTRHTATVKTATATRDTIKALPQAEPGMKQFVNVSVGNILNEMAAYYGLKTEIRSDEAARIRLYFNWNKQYGATQVVEQLNQFEHIHVTLDGGALVLEAAGGTEQ